MDTKAEWFVSGQNALGNLSFGLNIEIHALTSIYCIRDEHGNNIRVTSSLPKRLRYFPTLIFASNVFFLKSQKIELFPIQQGIMLLQDENV